MLREWDRQHPGRVENLFHAMANVVPSHLMDRNLHPFQTLQPTGTPDVAGDRAFDEDEDCATPARVMLQRRD
jgi:tRNA 2-thiocytidine biosynthesis protein TtcA